MKAKWMKVFALVGVVLIAGSCNDTSDIEEQSKQLTAELKQIDDYLAQAGITDILYDNTTGIRIVIQNFGQGPQPKSSTRVKVSRTGRLLSDQTTPFEQGTITDELTDILPLGLQRAIGATLEGTSAAVYIPSSYGFQAAGKDGVPPNSVLVYNFTLESIIRTDAEKAQAKTDSAAIKKYLDDNKITDAVRLSSGLYYRINEPGNGVTPNVYSVVSFDYKLWKLATPTTIVEENKLTNQPLLSLVDAFKIGIPRVPKGTTVTLYVPSGLGYGPKGPGNIGDNTNLIFEVKLTDVILND